MAGKKRDQVVPTREAVTAFIRDADAPVSKREIGRALHVGTGHRRALNAILNELEDDSIINRAERRYSSSGGVPPVGVVEVCALDQDGEPLLRPVSWQSAGPPPRIHLVPERKGTAPGLGDRMLARLKPLNSGGYEARIMRRLASQPESVLGLFTAMDSGGRVRPADRKIKSEFMIAAADTMDARDGELVQCKVLSGKVRGLPHARVTERLGREDAPGAASLMAIHKSGIPTNFPQPALDQASAAAPAPMDKRADLRAIGLVTIDDEEARDFDDAVWAEADTDPTNSGGWHLLVAIADVAWYVTPDSALDSCARERGNSVYFPDRVVPMLPGKLSNDLCSLRPDEDRPCLAVHIWIDRDGNKRRHQFVRGMMRSTARLTYRRVQDANDGKPLAAEDGIPKKIIDPLYGAYQALCEARQARGTIDLDLPERRVVMGEDGNVLRVETRERYDSHRLIEEFMIIANVCAAETLEEHRHPVMYRVHDEPPPDRVVALRQYLRTLGFRLAGGQAVRPRHFSQALKSVRETPHAHAVNTAILRSQAQAVYSPENLGHFGLALRRYSHFTSPIRRYSDLLVHRALIAALRLGAGGLADSAGEEFAELGAHLSMTERRATGAERQTMDRLMAAYLSDRVGAEFDGRINGVERFGLFVTLTETGADALLPASALGDDYFQFDAARHLLAGRRTREEFRLGDKIRVRLVETDRLTGGLLLALADRAPRSRGPARARRGGKVPRRGAKRKRR